MRKLDFYSGFEQDSGMAFREKTSEDEVVFELELWYGYFDIIVRLIPKVELMHPDSLIYNWFNVTGFYDRNEWECRRVKELYDQLLSIEGKVISEDRGAYNAWKEICHSTIQNGNRLFVEKDI